MNWDDLRIIAAVRDEGTYAGASARLRIDETTVGRRLARIQRDLGVPLFDAVDGLRRPTRHCEAVLEHVGAMAAHVAAIDRIKESQAGPVGRLRIASTNAVAEELLAPRASSFLRDHPGLTLQFLTSSGNVKFSRWQADLAIRLRKPEKGDFTISKLGDVRLYYFEPADRTSGEPVACVYPDEARHHPGSAVPAGEAADQRALRHRQCPHHRHHDPVASGRRRAARNTAVPRCSPTAACVPRCCRNGATSGFWCRTISSATQRHA